MYCTRASFSSSFLMPAVDSCMNQIQNLGGTQLQAILTELCHGLSQQVQSLKAPGLEEPDNSSHQSRASALG